MDSRRIGCLEITWRKLGYSRPKNFKLGMSQSLFTLEQGGWSWTPSVQGARMTLDSQSICRLAKFPYWLYRVFGDQLIEWSTQLLDPNPRVRRDAAGHLYCWLVNQGVISPEAYRYLPVLIAILTYKETFGMAEAADLLAEIAMGEADPKVKCRTTDGDILPLTEACRRKLVEHRAVFEDLQSHADPMIASEAQIVIEEMDEWNPQ